MHKFTYLASTACLAALLPTAVQAQDADEIVVTASGFEQPADETGQAITVITGDDLREKQIAVVSDAFRQVPSVSVVGSGNTGGVTSAFIRGANSSQTLVLIDGVRINDPSTPNGLSDFGRLVTGNIDRVEILRGPNSVVWGSQAIGGVINIRNAVPIAGLSGNVSAEYGSFDTLNARANIAGTSGILSGSIGGGYYRTDGISAFVNGDERDGFENYSANGKLKIALSETISIDLRGFYNNSRVEYDVTVFNPDFSSFADPESLPETRTEQFIGYVGVNADFMDGRFRNRIAYTHTDLDRKGSEPGGLTFADNRLIGSIDRLEYHGALDIAGDLATLSFGLEHEEIDSSTFFPAGGALSPTRNDSKVTSGFGQLILRPARGLTLTGGIRHDDYSLFGGETTFGGNIAYTPNGGKTVLRATYAEGFRAPTLTESDPARGNPDLQPETARSFDAGIEHSFLDRRVTVRATYFNRKSNNQITFSFATSQSENIERVEAEGLELELQIQPTDRLAISGFYALVDAENRSPGAQLGNRLARRPVDSAGISADWETPLGLRIGTTVSLIGDSFDDNGNFTRLDGFVLTGVRAAMPVDEKIELFGRVDNLFDVDYENAAGFGSLGRAGYAGVRVHF